MKSSQPAANPNSQSIREAATSRGKSSVEAKALREAKRRKSAGERVVFCRLGKSIGVSTRV